MSGATIVCGTDLRDEGARAVDLAVAFGRALKARVVLVHATDAVVGSDPAAEVPEGMGSGAEGLRDRLQQRLESEASALERERARCEAAGIECDGTLVEGRPGEAVVREAADRAATLIVLGRRERRDGHRVGPTIHHVVRHADCPVAVTPTRGETPRTLKGARWLVGTDFSRHSAAAVGAARALAAACGGDLVMVHVTGPAGGEGKSYEERTPQELLREEGNREALRRLEALAAEPGPEARAVQRVSVQRPADELCAVAADERVTAIAVGTRGRTGLGRLFLGSVADDLLRESPLPVVLVREPPPHLAPWFPPPGGPPTELSANHLLVAVDFSEPARRALGLARHLAARLEVGVDVVHVHEPLRDVRRGLVARVASKAGPPEVDADVVAQLRRSLSELVAEVFGPDRQAVSLHVEVGRPVERILVVARARNSDLLLVGTTGRTGMERVLLGSVAERLVRECPVPVLTVH